MHAFDRQQLSEVGCCWGRSAPYFAYLVGWAGTVYLVNFLPKIPYIHRVYMVLANPLHTNYCAPPDLKVYLKSAACCFLHVRHALRVCQEYKSITDCGIEGMWHSDLVSISLHVETIFIT